MPSRVNSRQVFVSSSLARRDFARIARLEECIAFAEGNFGLIDFDRVIAFQNRARSLTR